MGVTTTSILFFALAFFTVYGVIHLWSAWEKASNCIFHITPKDECFCGKPKDKDMAHDKERCQPLREVL